MNPDGLLLIAAALWLAFQLLRGKLLDRLGVG